MTSARYPVAFLAFAVAGGALAQTPPAPGGMTLDRYLSVARGRLLERDADGDGRISAAEFASGGGGRGAKGAAVPAGGMGQRLFARLDTNGDGYLDKAEIDAMLTQRFARMDADHDGIVSAEEREAARGAMRGGMDPQQ